MSAIQPTINCKLDEEQMDVLLGDIRDLIGRVDALEQRISDVNEAALYDFKHAERYANALEQRIEGLERKLNHKGGDE